MNISPTFCCALFPMQLPLFPQMSPIMLQCASSPGYIKSNFLRDEKLDMILQMSSCPLRDIVTYTELVVGFNCDIYEMWESNICAPFLLCLSYPEDFLFHKSESSFNCGHNWWIDLSGSIFLSCKLVSLEAVRVGMRVLWSLYAQSMVIPHCVATASHDAYEARINTLQLRSIPQCMATRSDCLHQER